MTTETIALPRSAARTRRPGTGAVYRWELRKLLAQKRTFIGLGAAVAVPLLFVIAMAAEGSGSGPDDLPFAAYVRETGFAVPLVCLAFGAFWLLPLVTALVAGDIVAAEDQNGTLKTILTRSVERWHVFAGKVLAALTYTAAVLFAYVGVALLAGGLIWGFDPLTRLSGTPINLRAPIEKVLDAFDIADKERFFLPAAPAGAAAPPGLPGQPPPPGGPAGVTNPEAAAGPLAPSNEDSLSPESMMQRFMAQRGTPAGG